MRQIPRPVLRAAGAALVLVAAAGCSSGTETPPTSADQSTTTVSPDATTPSAAPGGAGVSPGGVTTAVDAPAESTEDDYFQACRAARQWMVERGGDPRSQVEPYLKTVQNGQAAGPGTFGQRWSDLSPGRQAAVIVAVEAAADALCG